MSTILPGFFSTDVFTLWAVHKICRLGRGGGGGGGGRRGSKIIDFYLGEGGGQKAPILRLHSLWTGPLLTYQKGERREERRKSDESTQNFFFMTLGDYISMA